MKLNTRESIIVKAPSTYYMEGVNINYSFSSLENLAKSLGADVQAGDVLVVDNVLKTKRKAFKKTPNGYIILYVFLRNKNTFQVLRESQGRVTSRKNKPLIDFFKI